jgi:hypothetical protein
MKDGSPEDLTETVTCGMTEEKELSAMYSEWFGISIQGYSAINILILISRGYNTRFKQVAK